ncbi:hypothetical protein RHS01_08995 [Rhizoctonia solani]|uniref:Uncharacterized protein n=1 Tax=Rhizoctonia solani TaxID=456999 RepID=A0A8H7I9I6_9AGAM|nr:hypothetical protein RHS01_08995 [Rhizoctonia solani]
MLCGPLGWFAAGLAALATLAALTTITTVAAVTTIAAIATATTLGMVAVLVRENAIVWGVVCSTQFAGPPASTSGAWCGPALPAPGSVSQPRMK